MTTRRKARRTLAASRAVPTVVAKTRPSGYQLAGGLGLLVLALSVKDQRGDAPGRQGQGPPGLAGLGVAAVAVGAPDLHGRRYRRVGVRLTVEVDVVPGEGAEFLGARSGQQREHDVGVQPGSVGGVENGLGLVQGEGLGGRPSWPRGTVHSATTLRFTLSRAMRSIDRAVEAPVELTQGAGAEGGGLVCEPPVDVLGAKLTQLASAQRGDDVGAAQDLALGLGAV